MKTLLCCVGRQQNQYIREFVEYYKGIGFTNIVLCDNNYEGEERFEDVIGDYVDNGFVIIKDYRNRKVIQLIAYSECYNDYRQDYDWVAFFDCDEFLTLVKHKQVGDFLQDELFNDFNAIVVNWMCFGDNDLVNNDGGGCLKRFTKPISYDAKHDLTTPENYHVKTIVRCKNIETFRFINPHCTDIARQCNVLGKQHKPSTTFEEYDFSSAYLRHYSTKTIDEYCDKMIRGFPDQMWNGSRVKNFLNVHFFSVNKITKEKIEVVKNKLNIDLSYLLDEVCDDSGNEQHDS